MLRKGREVANSSEPFWPVAEQDVSRWLLLCVLVIATAYRFYGIDKYGLWGTELSDAVAVSHTGWLEMVSAMRYGDVRPPGYHTVLYVFSQLLGDSEFVLRLPSALAGVTSVYLVYLLGARIASPFAGLLAAMVLSGSYHAIEYSQEAMACSLLVTLCLANFYYLLSLLKAGADMLASQEDSVTRYPPAQLVGFWLTGVALAYQHYAGMAIVFIEMLLCLFVAVGVNHRHWCELLRRAFLPIGLFVVLWLPAMTTHVAKLWPLTKLVWPSDGDLDFLKAMLLGTSESLRAFAAAGFAGFICYVYTDVRQSARLHNISLLAVTGIFVFLLLVLFSAMIFLVPFSANPGLFIVLLPFLALLGASGVFFVARSIFLPRSMMALLVLLLCGIAMAQFNASRNGGLFAENKKRDLRMGVQLLAQDKAFMLSSGRTVFTSSPHLAHYLERYEIRRPENRRYAVVAGREGDVEKIAGAFREEDFYYLDTNVFKVSPLLMSLSRQYRELCQSAVGGMRIVKFSRAQPVAAESDKQECVMATVIVNGLEDK